MRMGIKGGCMKKLLMVVGLAICYPAIGASLRDNLKTGAAVVGTGAVAYGVYCIPGVSEYVSIVGLPALYLAGGGALSLANRGGNFVLNLAQERAVFTGGSILGFLVANKILKD